jgi:predicted alpha/beta-hydrolase family hydrolase
VTSPDAPVAPEIFYSGPERAPIYVLAHGAGAGHDSAFMVAMADLLAARGVRVARFDFAYMAERRAGKKRPPPKAERVVPEYRAALDRVAAEAAAGTTIVIGGKSMGGRVASLLAAEDTAPARGLACLGYPFHPPNQPGNLRVAHLAAIPCSTLIVQGERDPFGGRGEVEGFGLPSAIRFAWIGDGDHDFGPRGGSGFTRKGNLATAADALASFVLAL